MYALRPENVLFISVGALFIVFLIAPVKITGHVTFKSISYIVLCISGFIAGCKLINSKKRNDDISFKTKRKKIAKIYKVFFYLSLLAITLKTIDLYYLRGVSWTASTTENTETLSEGGGNIFSIVSSIFIFSTYIPVTLNFLAKELNTKKSKKYALLIFGYNLFDCIITGSRFALIRPIVYFTLLLFVSGTMNGKINKWVILASAVGVTVVANLVGAMFLRRLSDMNIDELASLRAEYAGYASTVPISDQYQKLMIESYGEWYYTYLFTYANVTQYISHAVFEFPAVMDYVDQKGDLLYGKSTFFVYIKFINKVLGSEEDITKAIDDHNLRPGIWSTFFFSWYLDFGWFGIFLFYLVGLFSKWVWKQTYAYRNFYFIPLVLFGTIIWSLTLQLNYIQGSGTYAITIFLLLGWLSRPRIVKKCS